MLREIKELLVYIDENDVFDEVSNDGDGHYDTWMSYEFEQLIKNVKEVIGSKSENQKIIDSL